jgi:hypothetical protein
MIEGKWSNPGRAAGGFRPIETGEYYMKLRKWMLPAMMAACSLLINVSHSYAKVEYTKKEKKPCVACHTSAKSKELNETGKCWEKNKSFEGCPAPEKK